MIDLALKFRPKSFDELFGQAHLCSKGAPLRELCERDALGHSFLFGPSGTGKTSLARTIATTMDRPFFELNATSLKIEQLRVLATQYKNALVKPIIFIDEAHRLAKNQQEVLLPIMEDNTALILGASTENPFFSLTAAIRSRSMLFELKGIDKDSMREILERAILSEKIEIEQKAREHMVDISGGDARAMLKLLEYATALEKKITKELLLTLKPLSQSRGSSESREHYDLASALIKSIRGSDLDASIYYLARLIEGGEPSEFIARRLVILASEDVGNANPQALTLATSTLTSVKQIGYPEARIILAQAVIYLASSPKSNSAYKAINSAQQAIKDGLLLDPPPNITQQNRDYLYPHDSGGWVKQNYLKEPHRFVELSSIGFELKLKEWLEKIKGVR